MNQAKSSNKIAKITQNQAKSSPVLTRFSPKPTPQIQQKPSKVKPSPDEVFAQAYTSNPAKSSKIKQSLNEVFA
jgi:hypothetical protein